MFLPNFDGDFVDVSGRREDGSGGRGWRTAAGLLTLGGWCSGWTASTFCGGHFICSKKKVSKIHKWPQEVTTGSPGYTRLTNGRWISRTTPTKHRTACPSHWPHHSKHDTRTIVLIQVQHRCTNVEGKRDLAEYTRVVETNCCQLYTSMNWKARKDVHLPWHLPRHLLRAIHVLHVVHLYIIIFTFQMSPQGCTFTP